MCKSSSFGAAGSCSIPVLAEPCAGDEVPRELSWLRRREAEPQNERDDDEEAACERVETLLSASAAAPTDDVELFERPAASVAAHVFAPTLSRLDRLASDAAPAMRLARARACLRRWAKQLKN